MTSSLLVTTTPSGVRATPPSGLIFIAAAASTCLSTRWSSTSPHTEPASRADFLAALISSSLRPDGSAFGDIGFSCQFVEKIRSDSLRKHGAGVADVASGLAALDLGEDRLQQNTGTAVRPDVAPEPGKIGRRAQFKQARLLASSDINRLCKARFRAQQILLYLP